MPSIASRTDLHGRPAQLQQHRWLSEQHLAGSTERGLLHKRQGRQCAEQQGVRHPRPLSLHLKLLDDRQDP